MKSKYPLSFQHDHTVASIRDRLSEKRSPSLVRDFIYGASDGIVTTFAIVAGVHGAELSKTTIIILGLSNIVADGFSMAASNYLGTKSELDEKNLATDFERKQIELNPEGEKEEIRQIYISKGFSGQLLEDVVNVIIKNKELWLNTMLEEEYGFSSATKSPLKASAITFLAFLSFGLIPLSPFLLGLHNDFFYTGLFTLLAFFVLGAFKSQWSLESAWSSALKTVLLGSFAAGLAYIIGVLLKNL